MSVRPTLVFLHGWGFDATFMAPLRALLSDWPQRAMDRGYFGDETDAHVGTPLRTSADEKIVVIGHSFGFLNALMSLTAPTNPADDSTSGDCITRGVSCRFGSDINRATALVSINGFTRFSATDDFQEGVSPRVIDRMMTKIRAAPQAVVSDFRQRCSGEPATLPSFSASALDVERLVEDLQTLRHGDGRDFYRALTEAPAVSNASAVSSVSNASAVTNAALPCLILAGTHDAIVPAAMTRAAFADQTILWHDGGDHLLPTSATAWCAQHIRSFLETLAVDTPQNGKQGAQQ